MKNVAFKLLISLLILSITVTGISFNYESAYGESGYSGATDAGIWEEPTDSGIDKPENKRKTTEPSINKKKEKDNISPQADSTEYISVEQITGSKAVTGVSPSASFTSSNSAIATYENGKILGHAEGVTLVKIPADGGGFKKCYVSVYYKYPQPKSAIVSGSQKLSHWAEWNNTDYNGDTMSDGDVVSAKWRAKSTRHPVMKPCNTSKKGQNPAIFQVKTSMKDR